MTGPLKTSVDMIASLLDIDGDLEIDKQLIYRFLRGLIP